MINIMLSILLVINVLLFLGIAIAIENDNKWKGPKGPEGTKPIICTTTGQQFSGLTETSLALNIPISCISRVINGTRKTTHGLKFKYKDKNE